MQKVKKEIASMYARDGVRLDAEFIVLTVRVSFPCC
jgi:hypothetical protein